MKDPLLPIGSVVTIEDRAEEHYIIIGHRVVNYRNLRAWDYISASFPEGLTRNFKPDNSFDCDNFLYFNHYDIEEVVYTMNFKVKEGSE